MRGGGARAISWARGPRGAARPPTVRPAHFRPPVTRLDGWRRARYSSIGGRARACGWHAAPPAGRPQRRHQRVCALDVFDALEVLDILDRSGQIASQPNRSPGRPRALNNRRRAFWSVKSDYCRLFKARHRLGIVYWRARARLTGQNLGQFRAARYHFIISRGAGRRARASWPRWRPIGWRGRAAPAPAPGWGRTPTGAR